ncbi:disease resistance-like protein [Cinnamomum micranthum f. kanehirae]|uniref:Disease resistance-like protein n=1 Tax=Cinnamomum micranthum f. kanehirae TaxID=337451 RepID=A0A3S3NG84_9MAGN|nr:disease resistance-like protein [Cinnamomum micranthum f. kanehirae]
MVELIQTENHDILSLLEEHLKHPPRDMEDYRRWILEELKRPAIKVLSVVSSNDYGLQCSRMAKYVAEAAIKSKQYDAVLWIDPVRDSSPRKLQMRIAEKLGLQLLLPRVKARDIATATATTEEEEEQDDEEEDENTALDERAAIIITDLINRKLKLLLVIDCVRTIINVGFLYPNLLKEAKFLVMSHHNCTGLQFLGLKVDETLPMGFDPSGWWARYCISEMLVMEARDVADSLRMNHHITLELNTILYCITYLLLMPNSQGRVGEEELSRDYMGEGLIPLIGDGEEDMNIDRASAITKTLLMEVVSHTIFKFECGTKDGNKDIYVRMDDYLWEALRREDILDTYQDRLGIASTPEEMIESNCKWISLAMKNIQTLPPTPPSCPAVTTLLLFGNKEMKSIPDDFFEHMTSLRVLDLSCTALTSLPSSISCLRNCLRFIKLQNCPSLETLPHSFKHLESLQLLDLSNTPLSTMPDDSFEHMYNLRLINLSHTKISSLSSSISNCCKLEQLFLKGCQSLETLPPYVFRLEKLQVFDISECTVLGLKEIPFIMPNLRVLNMSKSSIQLASLSLKGFLSLEIIQLPHVTNLEFLDLSNTKITEFPHEICEMTSLKRLDLVNTRQLKRVQWEKIKWLPQVLNWDPCGCGYGYFEEGRGWLLRKTQPTSINEGGGLFPLISVSNASIFKSLEDSSPLWKNCFTQFYIRISPCARQQQQQQQINKVVVPDYASKGRFLYRRVYDRMKEKHAIAPVHFRRYLEMGGVKSLNRVGRTGIKAIARQTELLWLHDNDFLTSLTDLDLESSKIVEECQIERCHTMHNIFDKDPEEKHIRGIRRLWVSELLKLKTLYDGHHDFLSLQHLSLWWCPNLTTLFSYPYFPNLETLEIRFCPRLECIYKRKGTRGERVFPRLHTLCLWDLRKLKILYDGYLPILKKLKVGRCPKLQKLPILPPSTSNNGDPDAAQPIEIQGESKWCDNIKWEGRGGTRRPINFKKVQSPRWFYRK